MRSLHLFTILVITGWLAVPAAAQSGRIYGTVRDTNGEPIKGATVRASHPDTGTGEITSTTDAKGRFALVGMRVSPRWHFLAEAPGFLPVESIARVRAGLHQLIFTLLPDLSPPPGTLDRFIRQKITAANALRDAGRLDQAITAYQAILSANAKLTTINLVLAGIYREKAKDESDTAARQALLMKAEAADQALLKKNANNERATVGRGGVTADLSNQTELEPSSPEANRELGIADEPRVGGANLPGRRRLQPPVD